LAALFAAFDPVIGSFFLRRHGLEYIHLLEVGGRQGGDLEHNPANLASRKADWPRKILLQAWVCDFKAGFIAFILTTMLVVFGVMFAIGFLSQAHGQKDIPVPKNVDAFFHFDAFHYLKIVEDGYSYNPGKSSMVAFFPAYPLAGRMVIELTGLNPRWTMLLLANFMLLGAFVFFSTYLRSRFPQDTPTNRFLILALFGLAPAGLFFRMPYSESTFLLLTLFTMVAMVRRWPLLMVALLTGAVTAARPVGGAMTAAFLCHIILDEERGPIKRRLMIGVGLLPIACWGLIA